MKILFVSNLFPDAGQPYRGLDNVTILHHLRQRGHDIRAVSPRPGLRARSWQPRAQDASFKPLLLPVPYVPKLGGLFNHRLMARALTPVLRGLAADWAWDVLLASWLFPDGWAAAHAARQTLPQAPVVLIAQGSDAHQYLQSAPRKKAILQACDHAAALITRSRSLGDILAAHGAPAAKIRPVPNGVDTQVFHGGDPAAARQELGLDPGDRWLLFVGNLLPVKNPEFLLRAFARLARTHGPRLRLALAGKGPLQRRLQGLAGELGIAAQTRFLGPLAAAEIARWMRAADLLALTSVNEGLPNVILEAQACGLPVAATDVGGIREVIDHPQAGLLTPEGDLAAWTRAADQLLRTPIDRAALSQRGMARSWPATAEAYEKILQLSLAQPNPPLLRTPHG